MGFLISPGVAQSRVSICYATWNASHPLTFGLLPFALLTRSRGIFSLSQRKLHSVRGRLHCALCDDPIRTMGISFVVALDAQRPRSSLAMCYIRPLCPGACGSVRLRGWCLQTAVPRTDREGKAEKLVE